MARVKFYFDRDIVKSEAFRSMGAASIIVYLDFRMRCKVRKNKGHSGKRNIWDITNNGELEYTYSEAEKKGITRTRFMRAIDELVKKGFIDIKHSGSGGKKGDKSLYAISDRWRLWGAAEFVTKTRPKDKRGGRGFAAYWELKNKPSVS